MPYGQAIFLRLLLPVAERAFQRRAYRGKSPKYDLRVHPVRGGVRNGTISKLSIKLPLSSINRVKYLSTDSRLLRIGFDT